MNMPTRCAFESNLRPPVGNFLRRQCASTLWHQLTPPREAAAVRRILGNVLLVPISTECRVRVRRRKPAVQANRGRSRFLKSKCNHDRRLMAGCVGSRTAASEQRNLDCRCKPELSGSWTSTGSLEELQLQLHSSNRRAAPTLTLPVNDRSLWPVRGVRRRRSIVCPESRGSSRERAGPKPTDVHRHSRSPDHSMHSA